MADRILVFIPTYQERENAPQMFSQLSALGQNLDILFMDDNSPDGTGQILDDLAAQHGHLRVIHRAGKLGVGSAHLEGIRYAYEHGYDVLVTMDCDFTHNPTDIPRLLAASPEASIVVGSRWMQRNSLPGWSPMRRALTLTGHFLTKHLLKMPHDASGAFRVYRLRRIPREVFDLVTSRSYAFFFESLFILSHCGCSIVEVPIVLPARTYGHSKMSLRDAAWSVRFLVTLWLESRINPGRFRPGRLPTLNPALVDPQDWDAYWRKKQDVSGVVYELIAAIYRSMFIRRRLEGAIRSHFPRGAELLHAGCGSGQVDGGLHRRFRVTAVDISPQALYLYSQNNQRAARVLHASIFDLPLPNASLDGIYNLGVFEHFTDDEINRMLTEFRRVLRPGGKALIFWPHRLAPSVFVLGLAHVFLHRVLKNNKQLHPAEISLLGSRRQAGTAFEQAGFKLCDYRFSLEDLFIQAIVVGQKPAETCAPVVHSATVMKRPGGEPTDVLVAEGCVPAMPSC